jgi:hypothetical protein
MKSRKKQADIKKELHREQYCGLSHFHDGVYQTWFPTLVKTIGDTMHRPMASIYSRDLSRLLLGPWEELF